MNTVYKILIMLVCFTSPIAIAADIPSALELLDKYATNLDKVSSFIVKNETVATVKEPNEEKPNILHYDMDARVDGEKSRIFEKQWFDPSSKDKPFTIDNPYLSDLLWDGERCLNYRVGTIVTLSDEKAAKHALSAMFSGVALFGIWYNYDERLDAVLRKIEAISVRDKLEKVDTNDCYVINAKTTTGTYTVWFDPQHGYQIAKAEIHLGPGSHYLNSLLVEDESCFISIRNISYNNIDGVWIPMETDIHEELKSPKSERNFINDLHHKITEITLNPDHESLNSFEQSIPNGMPVIDLTLGIKYTWQDGKLIPDVDEYAVGQIREMAQELKNQNKVPPGLTTTEITETTTGDQITDSNSSTESQTNANDMGREMQAQSRPILYIVLTLISLSIIALIGWKIFIRSKN